MRRQQGPHQRNDRKGADAENKGRRLPKSAQRLGRRFLDRPRRIGVFRHDFPLSAYRAATVSRNCTASAKRDGLSQIVCRMSRDVLLLVCHNNHITILIQVSSLAE